MPKVATDAALREAREGKPETVTLAQLQAALDKGDAKQPIGFLEGKLYVPDDFDTMGGKDIAEMFDGLELER